MAESGKNASWVYALYLLLLLAGLILFTIGITNYQYAARLGEQTVGSALLTALGALTVIMTVAMFPIAWSLTRSGGGGNDDVAQLLRSVNDRLLISDAAKRISQRQRDRDLLRRAIQEDLARRDLDGAFALAIDLANVYGYKQEAEEIREKIRQERAVQYQERVNTAIASLEQLLADHKWEEANAEAEKIQRLFPDSPRVQQLPNRVKHAWVQHKHDLERQFLEAAKRDDIERAMELLKELDKYLEPSEAAPFTEVARGVIGKKKENLGVQFKLAVHDREWIEAVQVGEQVIREFPNTRMADEVRSMLDLLRERAAGQRAATQNAAT